MNAISAVDDEIWSLKNKEEVEVIRGSELMAEINSNRFRIWSVNSVREGNARNKLIG